MVTDTCSSQSLNTKQEFTVDKLKLKTHLIKKIQKMREKKSVFQLKITVPESINCNQISNVLGCYHNNIQYWLITNLYRLFAVFLNFLLFGSKMTMRCRKETIYFFLFMRSTRRVNFWLWIWRQDDWNRTTICMMYL